MSIRLLSENEFQKLKSSIENNGWKSERNIEDFFRYSVKKKKLFTFTLKFPVTLPVRLNVPFEVTNFKLSAAFQLWNLDQNTIPFMSYILKSLRDLALQISIDHDFPMKGKEEDLLELLNLILPETIQKEDERSWLNRIRISLTNKREDIEQFSSNELKNIVEVLQSLGLNPTFELPWELKDGVPKMRTTEALFFSTEEKFQEFFILEKGYFTYFKDFNFNKIHLRTFFESYTPYILKKLFEIEPEFKIELLVENWVKFSRLLLNSALNIINKSNTIPTMFVQFRPEAELGEDDFEQTKNNFPLTALNYESSIAKKLYSIHNDLLNRAPTDFAVLESLNLYTQAEELINNYQFDEAVNILNNALKIFNKFKQKKVVASILIKLAKVSNLLKRDELALNYLTSALNVAKTGEIPLEYIIKIHHKIGKIHFEQKEYQKALDHFRIIVNFLENEKNIFENDSTYLGLAYIYSGLINTEFSRNAEALDLFKKAFEISKRSTEVKLKYHLLRARYYKSIGNIAQAQKLLKMSVKNINFKTIDDTHHKVIIQLKLELAEYYIHQRRDNKKAMHYLKQVDKMLDLKTIDGLKGSLRWNRLMSDYYNFLEKNREKRKHYVQQSRILQTQLEKIGVMD